MKIAIPVVDEKLSAHFGHCEYFSLYEVDENTKSIRSQSQHTPPPHEPGLLPQWLHDLGADVIISGGMGQRAQRLFQQKGIQVIVGASNDPPETIVTHYINNSLETSSNMCDH